MEPGSQDVRQALGRPVLLRCSLLRGSPQRIASAVWRFKGQLLPPPPAVPVTAEAPDHSELRLDAVTRESSGSYECSVSNDVGSAVCLFHVSGERPSGPAHPGPDPAHPGPDPAQLHPRPLPAWSSAPSAHVHPVYAPSLGPLPCQGPAMPGVAGLSDLTGTSCSPPHSSRPL